MFTEYGMSASYWESRPELKGQLERKIEGILSGTTGMTGASQWSHQEVVKYSHFEITNITQFSAGLETTANVYFPGEVKNLVLKTDVSGEEINDFAIGLPLPGPPHSTRKKVPKTPKRRNPKQGEKDSTPDSGQPE